jgi:hypothetical protein
MAARGRAVQVDPMKPKMKPPGAKRLKLKNDERPFRFAFKFNLRRYNLERAAGELDNERDAHVAMKDALAAHKVGQCRLTYVNRVESA